MEKEFKVGDLVSVKDNGACYSTYLNFFIENNLSQYTIDFIFDFAIPPGIYRIIEIGKHCNGEWIYVLRRDGKSQVFLMGNDFDEITKIDQPEPKPKVTAKKYKYELLPYVYHFAIYDNDNTNFILEPYSGESFDVIYNDKATIVIFEDGTKGVSKCAPDDKYDEKKGLNIALKRARIKSLQKELKELTK